MKISYSKKRFYSKRRKLLDKMIGIIENYERRGYRLTVRQVYYQLLARTYIENTESDYDRVAEILQKGRMIGEVDWSMIVDRGRIPKMHIEFDSPESFVDRVTTQYRRRRWEDQEHYVEVMVEKDALSAILEPVTSDLHVRLLANKGYSSVSALHDVALRLKGEFRRNKKCHILYLGDHDPSGLDMIRDVRKRLHEFGCTVEVEHLALTMEQITEHALPHNPAKFSDSRHTGYEAQHGRKSWELDALDPEILKGVLESSIRRYLDEDKYDRIRDREKEDIAKMRRGLGAA